MQSEDESREDGLGSEFTEQPNEAAGSASIFRREEGGGGGGGHPHREDGDNDNHQGASIADTLRNVAATLEADAPAADEIDTSILPRPPGSLAEVRLSRAFLMDLALKIIHYSGTPSTTQLVRRLGLGAPMVQQILGSLQEERLCEVLSQSDLYTGNYRYRLSERGTARVMEALERTRYAGPAPVTVEQYVEVMREQQAARQTPSRPHIKMILDEFVLAPEVADAVARALYSGKATMLYGLSGNGKTSILERFAKNLQGTVLVPHAVYAYGQVIRVFDPSIHRPVDDDGQKESQKDDGKMDRRWVSVHRPAVVLGSEIGPELLDPAYDPQARFYQAPPHVKAQGGILIVDDLGRQKMPPEELLSRWLIPTERGWDSLSLITGEKLTVPFDVQLLLATNRPISQLADDDILRRILYKVELPSPGPAEFAEILSGLCRQRNVHTPEGSIERVVQRLYGQPGVVPRASYARDFVEIVVEGAAYDGREPVLDEESVARAFKLQASESAADAAS